jgi:YD repeat-containing protein
MVAIFTGLGAGFERGSGSVLGSAGLLGSSALGRGNEQVFLNAANGNLMISQQDEFLSGVGPDVSITRTYNSLGDLTDNNGNNTSDNWRLESERKVFGLTGTLNSAGSTVHRMSADGSDITYAWNAVQSAYVATDGAGAWDTLTCTSNVWTWTDGDSQIKETYGADPNHSGSWRVTKETNADGYYVTYTYDDANTGRIQTVASSDGEYVQFDWSQYAASRIVSVQTFAGAQVGTSTPTLTRTQYKYDASNRLQTVTVDLSPNDNSTGDGKVYTTTYSYDASNRVNSIIESDGSRIDITYYGTGQVWTIAQTATTGVTRTTTLQYSAYDGAGNRTTTITDPLGQSVQLLSDSNGQLKQITMPPASSGAAAQVTQFAYDQKGNLTSVTDPLGSVTGYKYGVGPEFVTNGDGSSATGWTGSHASLSLSGGSLVVTSDNTGNQDYAYQQISGLVVGKTYTFTVDFGTTNGLGNPFIYLGTSANASDIGSITDYPNSGTHTYTFTATSTSMYVTLRSSSAGNGWSSSFDNISLKEATPGLATTITDRLLNVTTRTYGSKNELLTETTTNSDTSSPLATHTVRYVYDIENHLRYRISDILDRATNTVKGEVTEYRYTGQGYVYFLATYPEQNYDTGGLTSSQAPTETQVNTWRDGLPDRSSTGITYNTYDLRGNLLQTTDYSIATTAGVQTGAEGYTRTNFVYDQAGRLLSRYDQGRNTETFVYDGLGRLTSAVDVNGGTTSYVYDDANTRTIVTLATGVVKTSTYNKAGDLIAYSESTEPNAVANDLLLNGSDGWRMTNSQRVAGPSNSLPFVFQQTSASLDGYADNGGTAGLQPAPAGTTFNFSYKVKAGASGQQFQGSVYWYDSAGNYISGASFNDYPTDTVNFTTIQHQVTKPANAAYFLVSVLAVHGTAIGQFGALQFTAVPTASSSVPATDLYGYDADGRLRWEIDATGRKSYHLYDNVGRKVADVSGANINDASDPGAGEVTEYRYDADDRLIATIKYNNVLTAAQLASLDNANATADIANFRPASSTSDIWNWRIYDKEGRLTQSIAGDGSTAINAYDGAGRLVSTTSYFNKLTVTPFKTTLPTAITTPTTHAKDEVARNFYDADGRLIGALDGLGFLTRIIYDQAGQKTEEIAYANAATNTTGVFSAVLNSVAIDNANDRHTHYVYDGQGQLRFVVDSKLQVTETQFDNAGQPTAVICYANVLASGTTDFTYDNVKALVTAAGFAAADDRKIWSVYDAAGRVAYTIDGEGDVVQFTYNLLGEVTRKIEFAATRATASLPSQSTMDSWATSNLSNTSNRVTRSYYDGAGVLRYVVDAEGYLNRRTVDAEGRLIAVDRYSNALTVTDADTTSTVALMIPSAGAAVTTSTVYDVDGRVWKTTDGEGYVTRFVYNANGTLQSKTVADATTDASTTFYKYDAAGRVSEEHRAYGAPEEAVTYYSYDAFGNVVSVTDPNGTITYNYYDKANNLTATCADVTGLKYVTERTYNAFGEVVSETRRYNSASGTISQTTPPTVTANAYDELTRFAYDLLGRQTKITDALNYDTVTAYNAFGEVASITRGSAVTSYKYDHIGRQTKITDAGGIDTIKGYDPFSDLTSVTRAGVTTYFTYDKLGRLRATTDGEGFFEINNYDAFNKTSFTNKLNATTYYLYDKRGLLKSETLPMSSVKSDGTTQANAVTNSFTYDGRGNRKTMVEAAGLTEQRTTTYAYDLLDRLKTKTSDTVAALSQPDSTTTANVTPTENYTYDKVGNLQLIDANGAKTFSYYDAFGRKTAEVNALGTLTKWTYDAFNKRSETVYGDFVALPASPGGNPPAGGSNFRTTNFGYDQLNRLTSTSVDNALVGTWDQANSGISRSTVTITSWLYYDMYGNVVLSVDGNGNNTYSYYDLLGRKTVQVDPLNYVTQWTYDGEGNVLSETRYATALASGPTINVVPAMPASNANDRITNFTYDKNGHRLTETRTGVAITTVNATNGALTTTTGSSTVTYTYNGLGQVLTKAEATGNAVSYTYDSAGRLTKESRASYNDQTNTSVTPTVNYYYNGLNNLMRTQQGGATTAAGDRVTVYQYGAGGRLTTMRTALRGSDTIAADISTMTIGEAHNYAYDAAGNLLRDSYTRIKSDATTATDGILYTRDLLGRVVSQCVANNNGTSWVKGDIQNTQYDAYGEVAQRGVNGLWQETFIYNNRGLVEQTNTGDGVWRLYVYDKGGNQVLAIESAGKDYTPTGTPPQSKLSIALTDVGTYGTSYTSGVNATITLYNGRNQVTQVRQPNRETTAVGSAFTTIVNSQTYNAFGEVATQTGPLANADDANNPTVTQYFYNTMGRLIQKVMPKVSVTSATGVVSVVAPTENYFYDASGRQVATQDANGNIVSETLLAGSGYGGSDAQVTAEFHADGGIKKTAYDVFGDARTLTDELNRNETRTYDGMGRVVAIVRRTGLQEAFTYDLLGQQIKHVFKDAAGNVLANGTDTTDYDLQGRVTITVDAGGDKTTYAYSWDGTIATALGTTGGFVKVTTQWAQLGSSLWKTKSEKTDVHGLTAAETDFGNNTTNYTYDRAARLTQKQGTSGAIVTTLTNTYFNTGLVATVADSTTGMTANNITSTYNYDAMGRRTKEKYYANSLYRSYSDSSYTTLTNVANQTLEDATITYDALGRLKSFNSTSATGTTTVNQYYDAAGNIRRTQSTSPNLVSGGSVSTDKWFTYDAMNRMVIVDGTFDGTQVTDYNSANGNVLTYDVAGNRKTASHTYEESYYDSEMGYWDYYDVTTSESYDYDADNQLTNFYKDGTLKARTTRDIRGRVTEYVEYDYSYTNPNNGIANHRYNIVYNARGQVSSESDFQWIDNGTDIPSAITNTYDNWGNLTYQRSVNTNGLKDTWQSWTIAWHGQADIAGSTFDRDYYGSNNNYTSTQYYDGLGRLQRAFIADGKPRAVHYALNADGQVISCVQNDGTSNDPRAYHQFVNGVQIAEYTNDAGEDTRNYDYQQLIYTKIPAYSGSGRFYHNATTGTAGAETGTSGYDPINAITAGTGQSSRSRYTVQGGDTLQGIAQSLWGDSSLWYKLAEANGLSADSTLTAGQALSIPLRGPSNFNNANMFRPYDASSAVGDLNPTSAKPPKKAKCGMFGQILLVAIAVAVTVILAPTIIGAPAVLAANGSVITGATGLTAALGGTAAAAGSAAAIGAGVVGGALVGAASSIVSQGFGVLTGIQTSFSWKGVALSALSGGINGGITGAGILSAQTFGAGAARGLLSSAATQGIGVITGLQKKFDWAAVAAAGLAGGISAEVGRRIGAAPLKLDKSIANYALNGVADMAGSIANAATRTLASGTDFGDNLLAALPDVIGGTIGNLLANAVKEVSVAAVRVAKPKTEADRTREEYGREVAALQDPTDKKAVLDEIARQAALKKAPLSFDEKHAILHNYLYDHKILPGQITVDELMEIRAKVFDKKLNKYLTLSPTKANATKYARILSDYMAHYGLVTVAQQAAFLGQVYVETGALRTLEENTNYPYSIVAASKRVKDHGGIDKKVFDKDYVGHPDKIASLFYQNSNGNGNEASGDGWKYRGRGFLQTTWFDNYNDIGYANNPDALLNPRTAAEAAMKFWDKNGLIEFTQSALTSKEYYSVSQKVNNPYGTPRDAGLRWDFYQSALRTITQR